MRPDSPLPIRPRRGTLQATSPSGLPRAKGAGGAVVYDPLNLYAPRFDMTEFKKPSLRDLADEVGSALEHGDVYLNRRTGDFAILPRAYLMERSRKGTSATLEPEIEQLIDDID